MRAQLRIKRFNPERDPGPRWLEYKVEAEPTDRVLDALHDVKWYQDGTLTLRRSCAHGICGSDAMMINGQNRLACQVLLKDLSQPITIEPMRGFPVIKDLVVDQEGFFEQYRSVMPYLVNDDLPPVGAERLQSPKERTRFDDTTKCILCGACTTACPVFWFDQTYIGPAAIVQAHRFTFDSRDQAHAERLRVLGQDNGAFQCRTIFNCTSACPRGIEVTKAIQEVKREILLHPPASKEWLMTTIRESLTFERLVGLTSLGVAGVLGLLSAYFMLYQVGLGGTLDTLRQPDIGTLLITVIQNFISILESPDLGGDFGAVVFVPLILPSALLALVLGIVMLRSPRARS